MVLKDREVFILDGTKWEYFIDGKRAKSHREKNVLVIFTNELAEAIKSGTWTARIPFSLHLRISSQA